MSMTPLPSAEAEQIEEALSTIYELAEKNQNSKEAIEKGLTEELSVNLLDKLIAMRYVEINGSNVQFTAEGRRLALQVVRRMRLAERLMKDVLNLPDDLVDAAACQWEHVLSREVTNSICTLLGHPTFSPQDQPIPEGDCCKKETKAVTAVIRSLNDLQRGDRGKINYVLLKQRPELGRLLSMGLTPGSEIEVLQRVPTFVVQIGESQLAFDDAIASAIFVHPI